ncbi:hypothetical protein FACS1894214_1440 [Planctomycetales bacterium]|nr:hypothetical protein FACS1894214_1440 [Planctomycetales bacterium]
MALFGKKKKDAGAENPAAEESGGVNLSKAKPAKEKPAKKEKKPAEPKSTEPKVQKPKARPDIYTLLLGLSVAALVLAVFLLFMNINAYGPSPLSGVPR